MDLRKFQFSAGLAIFLAAPAAFAQETRATLSGTATDPSGSVVNGAKIRLVNRDTDVAFDATTNQAGQYRFLFLNLGTYQLSRDGGVSDLCEGQHRAARRPVRHYRCGFPGGAAFGQHHRYQPGAAARGRESRPRGTNNEFLLDGAPNNAVYNGVNNIAFVPSVDAVEEFKVMTGVYDAQYGRTGGGVINVSIRSGSNNWHGSGYEFLKRTSN
jgi:hypothetical protein